MRPSFLLLLLTILLFSDAVAQTSLTQEFTINGKLSGRINGVIKLVYVNAENKNVIDTVPVIDGKFLFKGRIKQTHQASLRGNLRSSSVDDPNLLRFFLEPGVITVALSENNFKNAVITGSALNQEMSTLTKQKASIKKAQDAIGLAMDEVDKQRVNGKLTEALNKKRTALQADYAQIRDREKLVDYAYIQANPDSQLSPYLMDYYFQSRKLRLDSAELFYNSFTQKVKESYFGHYINELIRSRKSAAVGSKAPDFTRTAITGKPITLSSFKEKNYVLLDFWASWCVPCREENPAIKKLYETYQPKGLEMISISWDTKENLWKAAIEADGTGKWTHIMTDMFAPDDLSMREKYAVASIPTLILIDKTGKIIGRYRGSIEEGSMAELEQKLKEEL